jgi:hypothetical protein
MMPLTEERRRGGRVRNEVDIVQQRLFAALTPSGLSTKVDVPAVHAAADLFARRVWLVSAAGPSLPFNVRSTGFQPRTSRGVLEIHFECPILHSPR